MVPTFRFLQYASSVGRPSGTDDFFTRVRILSEAAMRESASNRLLSMATDGSSWHQLAKAFATAALTGSTGPLVESSIDVLASLAGLERDEQRLLASIERQVRIMREGPYLVACDLIEEASRASDPGSVQDLLEEAIANLRVARRNATTEFEQGVVEAHLGYVHFLVGNRAECQHRLTEAHEHLSSEADRLMAQSDRTQVLMTRLSTVVATYFWFVGIVVLAMKWKKVGRAEQARLALVELQPVLTALAVSVQAVGGPVLESYEPVLVDERWTFTRFRPAPDVPL